MAYIVASVDACRYVSVHICKRVCKVSMCVYLCCPALTSLHISKMQGDLLTCTRSKGGHVQARALHLASDFYACAQRSCA